MRRKLLIVLLAVLSVSGIAEAQGFGFQAGFLQSKEKYRVGSSNKFKKYPNKFENGFQVGVFYEYDIPGAKGFGFGVGVNYGYSYDRDRDKEYFNYEGTYLLKCDTIHQQQVIDVPIYLSWRIHFSKEAAFLIQTGPVLSYCLEDRVRVRFTLADENARGADLLDYTYDRLVSGTRDKVTMLTDGGARWPGIQTLAATTLYPDAQYLDADIHPFNVMWDVGLGIQYQRYSLRFNYAWGLRNLFQTRRCANDNDAYRLYDRKDEWSISLCYQFVPKKKSSNRK